MAYILYTGAECPSDFILSCGIIRPL